MRSETPRWRRYLRFWGPNVTADVDEEFRFHLEERYEDLVARGMDARRAREEAMRGFGNIDDVKSTCRHLAEEREMVMRRSEILGVLRQDAVFAVRQMRSNPSLTVAVVLTLALGIGATTAIFSVVNAVLLRPLPYRDAERMVAIWETVGPGQGRASVGHITDWSGQATVLEAIAAWQNRNYNLTGSGEPERIAGARVSPSFFDVQYMAPEAGRYFLPDETADSRVVILSHPLWQTQFNGDRSIVGRDITLSGEAYTVIGITPAAYTLTEFDERLWTPLSFTPEQRGNYGAHTFSVFGKLKPGVTLETAQAELARITADIKARQPDQMQDRGVRVQPYVEMLVGSYRTQLWVLLAAVGFVLLIGCGNVASLLLARATTRRKEIAIRGALGGGRNRLVRQLLTESLVLALVGGAAGVLVARVGVRFLVGMGPAWVPRLSEAGLQLDVLAFALGATLLCGMLFGLAPAVRATRVDLQSVLREGGRSSRGSARDRVRSLLVVTEIAVALVLLVSAALFIRSALRLQQIPLGFDASGVTMMRVALPQDRYGDSIAVQTGFARIVDQVRALPGVENAAATTRVPMWGLSIDIGLRVEGEPPKEGAPAIGHVRLITPNYFESLRFPLKRGRVLGETDMQPGAARAVVINETLARSLFGEQNPLGKRVSGWSPADDPQWREIVGVVGDVRAFGREAEVPPEIFMPYTQAPEGAWNAFQRGMTIVAKAQPGTNLAPALRTAVKSVDPLLPLYDVQPMTDVLAQATETRRFNTLLLSLLGATGLILAAIGIYGVIAFFVSQRTHEIGVRMALGATARDVTQMVVRQAVGLAVLGVIVGGTVSFWATRVLATMLFEVRATDPVAYVVSALVLITVALLAAVLPARRAARVEPLRSLGAP